MQIWHFDLPKYLVKSQFFKDHILTLSEINLNIIMMQALNNYG